MIFSKSKRQKSKKSALRQWLDAGVFALIVATIARTFVFEAYAIPSGSMEGTMLIGDHLYVNKMAYGPRLPMTPLAVPLIHNTLPFSIGKSYSDAIQLKYRRLPGFGKVKRDDIVVFNAPEGDTAIADDANLNYYQLCRMYGRDAVLNQYKIITHTPDKTDNLIKRCVALPGDKLEIRNAQVYVNDQPEKQHPHLMLSYFVQTDGTTPAIDEELSFVQRIDTRTAVYNLESKQVAVVANAPNVMSISPAIERPGIVPQMAGQWVFPCDTVHFKWNVDQYGPLVVPKAGATAVLTPSNIALYRRIITNYEGNTLHESNNGFYINGKPTDRYTFKMDYYFMTGDNRHQSLDSRYWGFVPEDHIVGKAWFVSYSYGANGPLTDMRWNRLLRSITALNN